MAYALLSAPSCTSNNLTAYFMDRLPDCNIKEMGNKYWTCNSMGHIHPVLGNKVIFDDNTLAESAGSCPVDLFTLLTDDKVSETVTPNIYWSCYLEECWSRGHLNPSYALTCTRCEASVKADIYV